MPRESREAYLMGMKAAALRIKPIRRVGTKPRKEYTPAEVIDAIYRAANTLALPLP